MPSLAHKLWNAAWSGDLALMTATLEAGAQVNGTAINDSTALEAAAFNAQDEACTLLLAAGADPNAFAQSTGESVLHQVITKRDDPRRTKIVVELIAAGADVTRRTKPGISTLCFMRDVRTRAETPLHRAAAYGDAAMIAALLKAGADRGAKDMHGESALTWASWHLRDKDILRLLLYGEFDGTIPASGANV